MSSTKDPIHHRALDRFRAAIQYKYRAERLHPALGDIWAAADPATGDADALVDLECTRARLARDADPRLADRLREYGITVEEATDE